MKSQNKENSVLNLSNSIDVGTQTDIKGIVNSTISLTKLNIKDVENIIDEISDLLDNKSYE